jgi:hypothetical protein
VLQWLVLAAAADVCCSIIAARLPASFCVMYMPVAETSALDDTAALWAYCSCDAVVVREQVVFSVPLLSAALHSVGIHRNASVSLQFLLDLLCCINAPVLAACSSSSQRWHGLFRWRVLPAGQGSKVAVRPVVCVGCIWSPPAWAVGMQRCWWHG